MTLGFVESSHYAAIEVYVEECLLPKNLTESSHEKVIHTYICAFSSKLIF